MTTTPAVSSAKILVIDDNPIIQRTLYFALRDKGYIVTMTGEIAEALKIIRKERFGLILLDIHFPPDASVGGGGGRDGFWAIDWLRRMDEAKDTPVIVISSDPPEKSQARAQAAGAAAYFQKPINKDELAATVATLLKPASGANPPPL
jgi:CheY-like chemotaxis protein